jgi:TRAP-type C4-dicarboxylate transport system substrate-binding protein
MPTPYPDGNFHTRNIMQFAADVDKATNGSLKIAIHSAGSLIKHAEIKRSVRQGTTPIGEMLESLSSNEAAVYGLDSVPFLATGYDASRKLYAAQKPYLEKQLASEGLMLLYSVPWPPQGLYAKREIKSVDDLKGLKFRTYNAMIGRIAALAGAVPTQIEVPDLPTGICDRPRRRDDHLGFHRRRHQVAGLPDALHRHAGLAAAQHRDREQGRFRQAVGRRKESGHDAAKVAEDRGWKLSIEEMTIKTKALKDAGIKVLPPESGVEGRPRQNRLDHCVRVGEVSWA